MVVCRLFVRALKVLLATQPFFTSLWELTPVRLRNMLYKLTMCIRMMNFIISYLIWDTCDLMCYIVSNISRTTLIFWELTSRLVLLLSNDI